MTAEAQAPFLYEKRGRIAYMTINRPEVRNALSRETIRRLDAAVHDFHEDEDVWVAILTGAGDVAFCAGVDLKEVSRRRDRQPGGTERRHPFWAPARGTFVRGLELWKPLIAAINGYCYGGGLELALACDIRVAAEHAVLAQAEVKHGVLPGGGGTQRLPRIAPLGIALEMLLTGDPIDAQEAWRIGLVNHVVPKGEALARAEQIAGRICENAPLAVRAIKELVYRGLGAPLPEALRLEALLRHTLDWTEDSKEGPRAFAERRPPQYRGR